MVLRDKEKIVGASTALPLQHADSAFQKPFLKAGMALDSIFYFGESVLLKDYRGQGTGSRFFDAREQAAARIRDRKDTMAAEELVTGISRGDTGALSRAITLVESTRPEDVEIAGGIVEACLRTADPGIRVGITGVPGVGKSTFIETLGLKLISKGKRVAVLAVDPSSTLSKGSILGDKTRMQHLSRAAQA